MPTIPGIGGPYRFFFYSFDCAEREHVHVQRDDAVCKFWLEPVELAKNHRFRPRELTVVRKLVVQNHDRIIKAWHEHCSDR